MTTETIEIRIREDGSRVVIRQIEQIGGSAQRTSSLLDMLKGALAGLAAYLSIQQVTKWIDAWQNATSVITNATKSVKEQAAVQEALFRSSQKAQVGFSGMVELYTRAARSGKELGASQQQILDFTDGIGVALAVSGTSAAQASGALLQLGQALGSGVVKAEEFNSVLEGAPIILQTVANNIEGVDGSIAKLRQMMLDQELTSKMFFDAFLKGTSDLDKQLGNVRQTFSGAMQYLDNAMTKFWGTLNDSVLMTDVFFKAVKFLSDNLDILISVLFGVGAAVAVAFAPAAIVRFIALIKTAWVLLAAHPLVALVGAVTALITYFAMFGDTINAGIDDITTMADVGSAAVDMMKEAWQGFSDFVTDIYDYLFMVQENGNGIALTGTVKTTEGMSNAYSGYFDDVNSGWLGMLQSVARVVDAIAGLLTGLGIGIGRFFKGIVQIVVNDFNEMYNKATSIVESTINTAVGGLNKLRNTVGMSLLDTVKFDRKNVDTEAAKNAGIAFRNSFDDGFKMQGGFMENQVKELITRAQVKAKSRSSGGGADLNTPLGNGSASLVEDAAKKAKSKANRDAERAAKEAEQALKQLKDAYEDLIGRLDPLHKVQMDYNKDLQTLKDALKAGLVSTADYDKYVVKLKEHYEDLLNPLGEVTKKLNEEIELAKMGNKERQIETSLRGHLESLKQKGVELTKQETEAIREQLAAVQRITEEEQKRQALRDRADDISGRNAVDNINRVGSMKSTGELSQDDSMLMSNDLLKNMGLDTSALQIGLDSQAKAYEQYYEQLQAMRDQDLISEREHSALKMQVWAKEQASRLQVVSGFFGNLAQLQNSNSKRMVAIGKSAAITQTIIKTYESATSAYAAMAGIPYVGPALGAAAAAAAVAAGMANVAAIKNQGMNGYKTGGYTGNYAVDAIAGYVHGQEFVMNAKATNQYRPILEDMNSGKDVYIENNNTSQSNDKSVNAMNLKIVNILDKELVYEAMRSQEGEDIILNTMKRNPEGA